MVASTTAARTPWPPTTDGTEMSVRTPDVAVPSLSSHYRGGKVRIRGVVDAEARR